MSITVYWSFDILANEEGYRVDDPVDISKKFLTDSVPYGSPYAICPSTKDHLKNLYGLKPIYDVRFQFDVKNSKVNIENSKIHLQDKLLVRSFSEKLFSFPLEFVFFTDQKTLEIEMVPAYLEDNDVVNKTIMIPGKFDIGKWIRPLDFSFHLKKNCYDDILSFKRTDIISYVHFKTHEKLKFKFFHFTPDLKYLINNLLATRNNKNKFYNLQWFYDIFNKRGFKQKILKEIKRNTI